MNLFFFYYIWTIGTTITPIIGSGVITSLVITNAGSGYSTTPTITTTGTTPIVGASGYTNGIYPLGISGGGGSGCTETFNISSGGLASITIINAGMKRIKAGT